MWNKKHTSHMLSLCITRSVSYGRLQEGRGHANCSPLTVFLTQYTQVMNIPSFQVNIDIYNPCLVLLPIA